LYVKLTHRIASIAANLDDLQSGLEACARAADTLHADTEKLGGLVGGSLRRSLTRHMREVRLCARDQRVALRELRKSIAMLCKELQSSAAVVCLPSAVTRVVLNRAT
jgi:hypothetical protein